jgi:hypothetical protein
VSTAAFSNPYEALISACDDDAVGTTRYTRQKKAVDPPYSHRFKPNIAFTAQQGTLNRRQRCWTMASPESASIPF